MGLRRLCRCLTLIATGLAVATPVAAGCAVPPEFTAQRRLESAGVVVVFRTRPAAIEIGRHFSVEAIVCAGPPARGLRVDAQMPEHRHGMNLGDVVRHYSTLDMERLHTHGEQLLRPLRLSPAAIDDLVAFLTDRSPGDGRTTSGRRWLRTTLTSSMAAPVTRRATRERRSQTASRAMR